MVEISYANDHVSKHSSILIGTVTFRRAKLGKI